MAAERLAGELVATDIWNLLGKRLDEIGQTDRAAEAWQRAGRAGVERVITTNTCMRPYPTPSAYWMRDRTTRHIIFWKKSLSRALASLPNWLLAQSSCWIGRKKAHTG